MGFGKRKNSLVADRAAIGIDSPTSKSRSDPVGKMIDLFLLEWGTLDEAARLRSLAWFSILVKAKHASSRLRITTVRIPSLVSEHHISNGLSSG